MFEKLIIKITTALSKSKIPYMIIGGQAVLLYGEPRLTKDIDITLGIDSERIDLLKPIIKKLSLKALVNNIEEFARSTNVLPLQDMQSGIRIDIIFSFSEYEAQAIKRAKLIKLNKKSVRFTSMEDLIIHKLIAGRPRDIEDVKNIVLKNSQSDIKYISKWLREFDIALDRNLSHLYQNILKEIRV